MGGRTPRSGGTAKAFGRGGRPGWDLRAAKARHLVLPLLETRRCANHINRIGIPCLQSCKTKPIRPEAQEKASAVWKKSYDEFDRQRTSAKQSQFPAMPGGARPGGRGAMVDCAKRSQLAPGVRKWARAGRLGAPAGVDCAKRSQFPRGQGWPRAVMAAGTAGVTHHAKQSQFPPAGATGRIWSRQLRAKRSNLPPTGLRGSPNAMKRVWEPRLLRRGAPRNDMSVIRPATLRPPC